MRTTLEPPVLRRLERSCNVKPGDWIRHAPSQPGLERIEAFFADHAYDPHRHDTYAIGWTLSGVQCFDYRGARRDSVTGCVIALHPDELHDGRAGADQGFRYRMLYLEPRLVRDALSDRAKHLPFLPAPVLQDRRLLGALHLSLDDLERPLATLEVEEAVLAIAEALLACDPSARGRPPSPACSIAVERARQLLDEEFRRVVNAAELEAAAGLDRYTLARQFRAMLGTSPYRYLTMRRLDHGRALIRAGASLAEAALAGGFADQSHMTRQFKRTYGLPPGRWAAIRRAG
jgi:AraC-like DNA-binding protein